MKDASHKSKMILTKIKNVFFSKVIGKLLMASSIFLLGKYVHYKMQFKHYIKEIEVKNRMLFIYLGQ